MLASTFDKGDKSYIAFAPPPAINTPKKPEFLPGPGEGTAPLKDHTQFALNPEAQAAIASLERTIEDDVTTSRAKPTLRTASSKQG